MDAWQHFLEMSALQEQEPRRLFVPQPGGPLPGPLPGGPHQQPGSPHHGPQPGQLAPHPPPAQQLAAAPEPAQLLSPVQPAQRFLAQGFGQVNLIDFDIEMPAVPAVNAVVSVDAMPAFDAVAYSAMPVLNANLASAVPRVREPMPYSLDAFRGTSSY